MAGQTDKEYQAENIQNQLNGLYGQLGQLNPKVNNRYNNYTPEYTTNDMMKNLDNLYGLQSNELSRTANQTTQAGQQDAASRLASQGVTSGSILNNSLNQVSGNTNSNLFNALEKLKANRMDANSDLMKYGNEQQLGLTDRASNMDLENLGNLYKKYGLMNSNLNSQMGNAQNFDDTTWLDDALAIINTGAKVAGAVTGKGGIFGGGGASSASGGRG